MVQRSRINQDDSSGSGSSGTDRSALAVHIHEFLLRQTPDLAQRRPDLIPVLQQVMRLAGTEFCRKRIPLAAEKLVRCGAWAYPGGRPKKEEPARAASAPSDKRFKAKMRLFHPDVTEFDLISAAYRRIFLDVELNGQSSTFFGMNDPAAFLAAFIRKMEDALKVHAQKEANIWSDDDQAGDTITAGALALNPNYDDQNVVPIDYADMVDKRRKIERILRIAQDHPLHLDTLKSMLDDRTPEEEAERLGVSPEDINRRREAAKLYVKRRLQPNKD